MLAQDRLDLGVAGRSPATTLIGMRAVFASPLCLTPAAFAGAASASDGMVMVNGSR